MISLDAAKGWCDDPEDPLYNHLITLPYPARHELLWREDNVYDILIVVGYNDAPVIPHKGSAIFIHLMTETESPTAGCIALYRKDLIEIIEKTDVSTRLIVPSQLASLSSLSSPPPGTPHELL